jgi:sporulation protein YlmC with PRC-barrel domain
MQKERRVDADSHLLRLSEMNDYEVADKDPDVRGWRVFSAEGVKFGKVNELIVDPDEMKVRYLDIEVDKGVEGVTDDRHLLVPVGVASIDEKDDKVFIRTVQTVSLLKTPPYKGGVVTRDYEDELRQSYFQEKTRSSDDEDYYNSEYFDDEKFYAPRRNRKVIPDTIDSERDNKIFTLSATTLIGDRVVNRAGEDLGKIEELMIDISEGRIAYAVLSFGGFLKIGEKYFAIPWEALELNKNERKFLLDVSEEKLENAPGFDKDNWPQSPDRAFQSDVYDYYGYKHYW